MNRHHSFIKAVTAALTAGVLGLPAYCVYAASLRGSVRCPDDKPAANFQVFIAPVSLSASPQAQTQTDEAGDFALDALNPGQYAIYPFDQSSAYPLRNDMFLSKNPDRIDIVTDGKTNISLVLSQPAVLIHGSISAEGKALSNVKVSLCHADETWRSGTIVTDERGKFVYVVPSDERLSVTVFLLDANPSTFGVFLFKPGDDVELDLKSEDIPADAQRSPCKPFG